MRYRNIHCLIWNDDKFPFSSDDCKLIFFHILTTPLSSSFGLYKASIGALADEMRWNIQRYTKGFREGLLKGYFLYDDKYYVLFIPNFLKYNPPHNPNVLRSWANTFNEIPQCSLKEQFYQSLKAFLESFDESFRDVFGKSFIKDYRNDPVTVTDNDTVTDSKKNNEIPYNEILADLNEKTEKHYKPTEKTKEFIRCRWKEGFTLEDFKKVHETMARLWKNQPKMNQYLRPVTLYCASKFEGYLNRKPSLSEKGIVSESTEKNLQVFERFLKEGDKDVKPSDI